MSSIIYRYPLDPTGVNPNNRVVDEEHQLSNRTVRCVGPTYGGFFAEGVIVKDAATNIPLIKGQDYIFGELFEFPTGRYGKEVFGIVVIKKTTVSKIKLTYQSLGGDYSYSMAAVIQMIENLNLGERPVGWGDIVGRPPTFTPASHLHDIGDVYGFEYIVHALERLRSAVMLGDTASHDEIYRYIDSWGDEIAAINTALRLEFEAHRNNQSNPHNTTKAQVGLGSVENYGLATQQEAETGTLNTKYMTPLRTAQAVSKQAVEPLNAHVARTNNPHAVTKAQVGLGSVENYTIASQQEAEAGASTVRYMTPQRTAQAITVQAVAPLNAHVNRTDNPHSTTKAQVGLSNVDNYGSASQADAETGTSTTVFMTPLRTSQAITRFALTPLNAHTARQDNPHSVTKAQVGLGNVENYGLASQPEAEAGTIHNNYMTPLRVAQAVSKQAIVPLNAHIGRIDNPHAVTKTQVGLGSVENYGISPQAEAEAGASTTFYMTPQRTAQAISRQALTPLNAHTARTDNPHSTTKAQVGLGSVENYGIASNLQATAGTANDLYMTPLRVKESIFAHALTNTNFSTATQAPMFLANNGLSNAGYSFRGDNGNDTGMFSTGDGDLRLLSNSENVITTSQGTPLVIHRRVDFAAMPMSMAGGEWLTPGSMHIMGTGAGDWGMAGMQFSIAGAYGIRMGMRADGYFGIGGASRPSWSWYTDPSGNMTSAGDVVAYSDPRLKENFELIEDPFALLEAVQGWSFDWKKGITHTAVKAGKHDYGFNALDVYKAAPELVHGSVEIEGETYLTVAYEKFAPFLSRAAVLLNERSLAQEKVIADLVDEIRQLKEALL